MASRHRPKAMKHKKVAASLRLDLAAYRELEAFAQLGTELEPATQRQLDRGARMVELLKQPQYVPMDVVDQVMVIYAGSQGFLDAIREGSRAGLGKGIFGVREHQHGADLKKELVAKKDLTPETLRRSWWKCIKQVHPITQVGKRRLT